MNTVLLILATALAPMIWGSTYIVASELLPQNIPFTSAAIRVLPGGLMLLALAFALPKPGQWPKLLLLSLLNIGLFQGLLFVAAYRLPGGLAAVLSAIQPLIVMLLIWLVQKQPPVLAALIAALTSVLGMAALLLTPDAQWDLTGVIAALSGAVSLGLGVFLTRYWSLELPILSFTGWQLTLGGLMLLPLAAAWEPQLPTLSPTQWLAYGYLAFAGSLIGYLLWFRGIQQLSPVAVSSLGLLSPLTAALLGWALLGQTLSGAALIGFITVLISVLMVQWAMIPKKALNPG